MYRYLLAFHVVAIISWMCGILYLFRLFVYHAAETENVVKLRFIVMERRLQRFITTPAMLASLALGVAMLSLNPALLHQGWLHAKLFFVFLLMGITGVAGKYRKELEAGTSTKSETFFRVMNEIPTLLMILIVVMVIVRPF